VLNWAETRTPLAEALRSSNRRRHSAGPYNVVIEKILGRDEPIPEQMADPRTTVMSFLNWLNGLFVASENASAFTGSTTASAITRAVGGYRAR